MPNASDIEGQDSTTPPDPNAGQPTDWEARFKGLQKTFNTQSSTLKAKEDALLAAIAERDNLKSGNNQALIDAQALIAQRQNELNTAQTAKTTLEQQLAAKNSELGKLQGLQTARAKLPALKAADLVTALDTGVLTFDSLEDADMTAKIANFRSFLASMGVGGQPPPPAADFSGATVPGVTVSTAGAPNRDSLYEWVMNPDNFGHADYQKNSDAYYASLTAK